MATGVTADDLAQMRAALAAEGYVWFTPLAGGPRRLVKGAAPAKSAREASDQDTPPGPDYVRCRPLSRRGKRRWIKGVNAPQERG